MFINNISERHLCALMLIDLNFRMVNAFYIIQWYYRHISMSVDLTVVSSNSYFFGAPRIWSFVQQCQLSFEQVQGDDLDSLSSVAQTCGLDLIRHEYAVHCNQQTSWRIIAYNKVSFAYWHVLYWSLYTEYASE